VASRLSKLFLLLDTDDVELPQSTACRRQWSLLLKLTALYNPFIIRG
jgi:hypothetical protein